MKTQYYTAASLDGFIADEHHSLDWLFALGDPPEPSYSDFIQNVGAIAMGSSTYEWLLRHGVGDKDPWPYAQPAWIFTTRELRKIDGADIRFVRGDVRPVHAEMKQAAGGRNIWLVGGGELVGQFCDAGLLDEIIVQIGAATLGAGKPLLPRRLTHGDLRLSSVQQLSPTLAELRYEVTAPTG